MTPAELRHRLDTLGLTQVAAARVLDVSARTMRYWVAGETDIPLAVDYALRWLATSPGGKLRAMVALFES